MKKILVPVDFTSASRNASGYAISLAKVLQAEVHLLYVYREPMPVGNVPDYQANTAVDLRTENAVRIEREVERLQKKYGFTVKGHIESGFKGDTINNSALTLDADLLVMGIKSAGKYRIPGSTTGKMIRKSNKPLLLIPEEATYRPLKNIVLAVDFNEMLSRSGMEVFFTLVKKFDASVSVLHVQKIGENMKAPETAVKRQMEKVLSGIAFHFEQMGANKVEEGILNFIDSSPADMLAMIPHHHSVLDRLFNPVHTAVIRFEVKLPLLVLKVQHPVE